MLFPPPAIPMPEDAIGPLPDPRWFLPHLNEPWPLDFLLARGFNPAAFSVENTNIEGVAFSAPVFDNEGRAVFQTAGACLIVSGPLRAMFIAMPEDDAWARLVVAFRIISSFVLGGDKDNQLDSPERRTLLASFLLNPRHLDLNCGPASLLLQCLLEHMGVLARHVRLINSHESEEYRRFHIMLEAFLPERAAWALIDVQYGLLFEAGFSAFAYLITDGLIQRTFVAAQIPKIFFELGDLETFATQGRIIALQTLRGREITLEDPHLKQEDQIALFGAPDTQIDVLPLDLFLQEATYAGTVFVPERLESLLRRRA